MKKINITKIIRLENNKLINTSFSYTTILYGSIQQKISKYIVLHSFNTSTIHIIHNNNIINIEIDTLRRRSVKPNINIFREILAYLIIFSISYIERIEV